MQFKVDTAIFSEKLEQASKAMATKSNLPNINGILIEAGDNIKLTATDLEWTLTIDCDAEVREPGKIVVPRKFIEQVAKIQKPTVEVVVTDFNAKLNWGSGTATIHCMDPDQFPLRNDVRLTGEVETAHLKDLAQLAFCAGEDRMRPLFMCIQTDGEYAFTTDSCRLAMLKTSIKLPLVTAEHIAKLAGIIEGETVRYGSDGKVARFAWDGGEAILRVVDGSILNYKQIIPKHNNQVRLNPQDLLDALAIIQPVASQNDKARKNIVKLYIGESEMRVTADGEEGRAEEVIYCECDEPLQITFNAKLLQECVKYVMPEQIAFGSEVQPVWMEKDGRAALVMPIRMA